ncbi:hypothetical protein PVAP13_6NG092300 [Panicum virgatum]|uniref:Photosystem II 10 kDa polypeptide, chloroplastic n=1 Tax=Panicum virgatum TaxID=38727 RepID=A0A8T0QWR2_PANVG|nr:hypothetical protein PVAP13_6NG092300 [Panicum virgatum]
MAASMISSSALAAPARAQGLPSLGRRASSFAVVCGTGKKIKTDKPFGIGGGLTVDHDASGRKVKGKGVYQFVDKYGANVDGYSPIYKEEDWSPTGDVYVGTTGLLIWSVTLIGLLAGGALLVYNTSALAS